MFLYYTLSKPYVMLFYCQITKKHGKKIKLGIHNCQTISIFALKYLPQINTNYVRSTANRKTKRL